MRLSTSPGHSHTDQRLTWWSRVGTAGFTFFLLKGILWLLAPVLFTLMR